MPEFCSFVGCLSYRVLSAVSFHPLAGLIGHTSVEFDNRDPGACRDGDLLGVGTAAAGAGREARSARCAGAGKTYGKVFDRCADFEKRLVQRQRAARALAVWYMADVHDSAPQR